MQVHVEAVVCVGCCADGGKFLGVAGHAGGGVNVNACVVGGGIISPEAGGEHSVLFGLCDGAAADEGLEGGGEICSVGRNGGLENRLRLLGHEAGNKVDFVNHAFSDLGEWVIEDVAVVDDGVPGYGGADVQEDFSRKGLQAIEALSSCSATAEGLNVRENSSS